MTPSDTSRGWRAGLLNRFSVVLPDRSRLTCNELAFELARRGFLSRSASRLRRRRHDYSRATLARRQRSLGALDAHYVLLPRHVPGQAGALLHPAVLEAR